MNEAPILVVDDDPKIVALVRTYLEREGFFVATAGDGKGALATFAETSPRLIVLDIMLPELDGLALLRLLRERSDVPVVLLSARGSTADRVFGIHVGADDYVVKPFSPAELVVRVKAVLRRADGQAKPPKSRGTIRVDDLTLDLDRLEVRRATQRLPLTVAEFKLLAALVEAEGRVLSRQALLDALYGPTQGDSLERTIDVHVGRLREKIGDSADDPRYIATVRGAGVSPGMTRGIALRIASIAILVMAVAVGVIAVGVVVVAQATFSHLMVQAGQSADVAREMFNHSVVVVFATAAVVAAIVGIGLALLLAIRLARPLRETASAAQRLAQGEYGVRVERSGPEEMASLADSFNQMAESLEEQERMRRDFIVNAAHELSTPLTNLQGYLEAMRDGVIPASPEQFQSLQEEVERLVRLSRSLQTLAADKVGGGERLERTDLVPAARTAIELARPSLEAKDIAFRVNLPATLPVRAHPDRLAQVLANLLQNAARYTPAGGTVQVNVEARGEDALVAIANSGDGIPARDLPHVFERFYRVEKSRDRARGGAGIGLAIVKQLVESLGGQVGVESSAGLTRFWVTIPS